MKKLIQTFVGALVAAVILSSSVLGLVGNVKADENYIGSWTDETGDVYALSRSTDYDGYALELVSDGGDCQVSCPASIDGTVVSEYRIPEYDNTLSVTIVNLINNPNLKHLSCNVSQVGVINTSYNPLLEVLDCYGCGVSQLDVSSNPELKQIECSNTSVSSLDVSNNPKLEMIYCDESSVSSIDVSCALL